MSIFYGELLLLFFSEKRVVHNFVSRLCDANRSTEEMRRPHSSPAGQIISNADRAIIPERQKSKIKQKNLCHESPTMLKSVSVLHVPKPQRPFSSDMKGVPSLPKEQPRTQSPVCASAGLERSKNEIGDKKKNQVCGYLKISKLH